MSSEQETLEDLTGRRAKATPFIGESSGEKAANACSHLVKFCCAYPWDFQRRPYRFVGEKSAAMFNTGSYRSLTRVQGSETIFTAYVVTLKYHCFLVWGVVSFRRISNTLHRSSSASLVGRLKLLCDYLKLFCVQGREAMELCGRPQHARPAPHRPYAKDVELACSVSVVALTRVTTAKVCFVATISEVPRQLLRMAGSDLKEDCLSPGQFYVACFRVSFACTRRRDILDIDLERDCRNVGDVPVNGQHPAYSSFTVTDRLQRGKKKKSPDHVQSVKGKISFPQRLTNRRQQFERTESSEIQRVAHRALNSRTLVPFRSLDREHPLNNSNGVTLPRADRGYLRIRGRCPLTAAEEALDSATRVLVVPMCFDLLCWSVPAWRLGSAVKVLPAFTEGRLRLQLLVDSVPSGGEDVTELHCLAPIMGGVDSSTLVLGGFYGGRNFTERGVFFHLEAARATNARIQFDLASDVKVLHQRNFLILDFRFVDLGSKVRDRD
ncbi:hypothetical protein PR048_032768 [Dryococelus australis]|uniref:Uncharacterized protein n=1 Tax=Dryococelus australis TaxID=614101 RepID=A0ABQ9G5Y8_9NEOP|nr:hypothetical protein PR048_032768 [Dryococelus australis]